MNRGCSDRVARMCMLIGTFTVCKWQKCHFLIRVFVVRKSHMRTFCASRIKCKWTVTREIIPSYICAKWSLKSTCVKSLIRLCKYQKVRFLTLCQIKRLFHRSVLYSAVHLGTCITYRLCCKLDSHYSRLHQLDRFVLLQLIGNILCHSWMLPLTSTLFHWTTTLYRLLVHPDRHSLRVQKVNWLYIGAPTPENVPPDMCAKQRIRSACAFA